MEFKKPPQSEGVAGSAEWLSQSDLMLILGVAAVILLFALMSGRRRRRRRGGYGDDTDCGIEFDFGDGGDGGGDGGGD